MKIVKGLYDSKFEKSHACGYCHFHHCYLTVKQLKAHQCLQKQCNAVHQWFVDHVQDGIDDCNYHHEVTKEILEWLRKSCETVLNASKFVPGKIYNGTTYKDGQAFHEYIDGTVIENTSVAEELLPTQGGFFFGGTDYDEWYIDSLRETIEIIDNVIATTDFETQMIYYVSSW